MFKIYEEDRNAIRLTMAEENWKDAMEMCINYLKQLNSCNYILDVNCKEEYWFVNLNMAKCCKNQGLLMKAYNIAKESVQYTEADNYDSNYLYSCWAIGAYGFEVGYKEEAIENFKICASEYKKIGEQRYRLLSLFNVAKAMESTKNMLRIIKIYEKNNVNEVFDTFGSMNKDDTLYEMYFDMFNLFVKQGDRLNISRTLNILKDKDLKKELSKYLFAA